MMNVKKSNWDKLRRKEGFFIYFQINRLISFVMKKYLDNDCWYWSFMYSIVLIKNNNSETTN